MEIVLGLDVSTTTIGISVLKRHKNKIKLMHYEYYKPDKKVSELKRLFDAKQYILNIAKKYKVTDFAIEEYIKYLGGGSSASTILPLAILNRTLCLGIYEYFDREPQMYNVLTVRHKLKFDKKLPAKEEMPYVVAEHLNIDPVLYTKFSKKKNEDQIMKVTYDVNDAIAVGLTHILKKS